MMSFTRRIYCFYTSCLFLHQSSKNFRIKKTRDCYRDFFLPYYNRTQNDGASGHGYPWVEQLIKVKRN